MKEAEILAELRANRRRDAVEVAELVGRLSHRGLTQSSMISYFSRAFPEIPLPVLMRGGEWIGVGGVGIGDEEFNEMLREWIGDGSEGSQEPST